MSRRSKTLEKTVVLVSPPLTRRKLEVLGYVYRAYGDILVESLEYMLSKGTTSWMKARKELYKVFRERYRELPSHYIHEAVRDASQRLKSFLKLKKRGVAKTDRPVVKKWSVGCDDQLRRLSLSGVEIATHRGWIRIPLHFHKLFWKYWNSGEWTMRSSARWRVSRGRLYLYVVFSKTVDPETATNPTNENRVGGSGKVYGIDVNENNVTIYDHQNKRAITIVTNLSKIVLGYAYRRQRLQEKWSGLYGVKGNRRLASSLKKLREKWVKRDVKLKLAKVVAEIVRDGVVVLEKLPKGFQDKVLERGRLKGIDAHRLKQASIRGIQRAIIEKLEETGTPYVLVDPRGTSSKCPICNSKLVPVTGSAQRNGWRSRPVKCPVCGFTHDRDVVGAMNIARKYILDVGGRAVGLPKGAHDHREEWLVATVKRGAEAQPILARPTTT
ncbi:MAG: RNA-guided endonuclease InsQ/TnpB family protein [Thermogladius sp.]